MLHTLHLSLTNDAKHVSLTEILNLQYRGVKTSEALITQCMLFVIIDLIAIRMWHLREKTRNIEATALFLLKPLISLQQHCFYILLLHKLKSALSSTLICPFCRVGSFFSCCTTHQITWPEGDALQLIKSYINIKADCFFFFCMSIKVFCCLTFPILTVLKWATSSVHLRLHSYSLFRIQKQNQMANGRFGPITKRIHIMRYHHKMRAT